MPGSLRLVFMGTPDFAVPTLQALVGAGHRVAAVYAGPPRPAGRGRKPRRAPVHAAAAALGIPVRTPTSLRSRAVARAFAAHGADIAVVAAYGLLLPPAILAAPRLGCVNLHASLLPRWRGAAPIQRAIMSGDTETGVCAMRMDEGLDTGPVLACERVAIGPSTTAGELHDRLAALGAALIVRAVEGLAEGVLEAVEQSAAGVTRAAKITPGDARLDWRRPAVELERLVRAMAPTPGAWFEHGGERIKVAMATVGERAPAAGPGTVVDSELTVRCGAGSLRLLRLQRSGRKPLSTAEFLRGYRLDAGIVLPSPTD